MHVKHENKQTRNGSNQKTIVSIPRGSVGVAGKVRRRLQKRTDLLGGLPSREPSQTGPKVQHRHMKQ